MNAGGFEQAVDDAGGVEMRAEIDVVDAEHLAGELVEQIILFVEVFAGGEDADGAGSTGFEQPFGGEIEGDIPVHIDPSAAILGPWGAVEQVLADAGAHQAAGMRMNS